MPGTWRLEVRLEFSASHRLENFKGKCEALHGHNFGVTVAVEGSRLSPENGLLMDFGDLKRETREALAVFDHSHLNDCEALAGKNPTSENLAAYLYAELKRRVAPYGVRPAYVTVAERDVQSATYFEEE